MEDCSVSHKCTILIFLCLLIKPNLLTSIILKTFGDDVHNEFCMLIVEGVSSYKHNGQIRQIYSKFVYCICHYLHAHFLILPILLQNLEKVPSYFSGEYIDLVTCLIEDYNASLGEPGTPSLIQEG